MKTLPWMFPCLLGLVGCADYDLKVVPPDGNRSLSDGGSCPTSRDMASYCSAPAAAGLTGNPLVCVDFTNNPSVAGWNLSVNSSCPWTINSGMLQLTNYASAGTIANMMDCGFTLPSFATSAYQGYANLTLAIQQTVDILGPPANLVAPGPVKYQTANISLNATTYWSTTGSIPSVVTTLQIPTAGLNSYQATFNLHADTNGAGSMAGWLIQSIALLASN